MSHATSRAGIVLYDHPYQQTRPDLIMQLQFITLDVFTSTPYVGNPLAIVKVPAETKELTQDRKQLIAREFNLSETVFYHEQTPEDEQASSVRIDIFHTDSEIPFAGHPTIGMSNYLLRHEKRNIKALQTKSGRNPVRLIENGDAVEIDVAHDLRIHERPFKESSLAEFPVVSIVKGMTFILIQKSNIQELSQQKKTLYEDWHNSSMLDHGWQVGSIGCYFYVDLGTDHAGIRQLQTRLWVSWEDPATGSAASALCSYLSLTEKCARVREYRITQGVEMGRKSDIGVEIMKDEEGKTLERVTLKGTAVKIMEGTLEVPS